jgi:hypothetical protein
MQCTGGICADDILKVLACTNDRYLLLEGRHSSNVTQPLHTAAVLEDKCYISLQQDKTYKQKDVLYFFLMFVNKPKYRTVVSARVGFVLFVDILKVLTVNLYK